MKTIANIATQPSRIDQLTKMIWSIKDQFDEINVYCNEFKDGIPGCLRRPKINAIVGSDLADNGKFFFLKKCKEGEIYFTLDDDIIYPKDYVSKTLAYLQIHDGCVVTYHGRKLGGIGYEYYTGHKVAHNFTGSTVKDEQIDVAGTGCMAFEITDKFHPIQLYQSKHRRMTDLIFSLDCAHNEKKIIACVKDYGWMKAINTEDGIFAKLHKNPTPIQNSIADEIYRLNYGNDKD